MITSQRGRRHLFRAIAIVFSTISMANIQFSNSQDATAEQSVDLVVDGNVQNVFQSGSESLVQILVQRSEVPRSKAITDANYPAPGECIYVHVSERQSTNDRLTRPSRQQGLPKISSRIRALLAIGRAGRWESVGLDWYTDGSRTGFDSASETSNLGRGGSKLGVTSRLVTSGRETALKVLSVAPNSPAAQAGLEPGDLLIQADRIALRSQQQLDEAYNSSRGNFSLTVRDVNTKRDVRVKIPMSSNTSGRGSVGRPKRGLGVTGKLAFFGGEPVVEVTAVQSDSPAQKAGLSQGLLILKAGGKAIASLKDLDQAERDSHGTLELQVVDPSNRRQRTIRVDL